jgi:hypothetical protein
MPIVAQQDTKAKKAMLFLVSNLCVIMRQITLDSISAIAVADDIKNKFAGKVSK